MQSPLPSARRVSDALGWVCRRHTLIAAVLALCYMEAMGSFSTFLWSSDRLVHRDDRAFMSTGKTLMVVTWIWSTTALYLTAIKLCAMSRRKQAAAVAIIAVLLFMQLQIRPARFVCVDGQRVCVATMRLAVVMPPMFLMMYHMVLVTLTGRVD